ncbi:hypothetical protein PV04_08778 [Phialophora macrospora]|uniref:Uncharacterized protein n=1 Tax=Phialophora macrospora TaxID=1851006 RepID=A0A0D2CF97_9EURO|nr:hypothetical protein PV04_08778 [Phialophora macrospora]
MSWNESDGGPLNRVWENKYTARRAEGVYKAEVPRESNDQAIFPNGMTLLDYLERDDIVGLTTAFLNVHRDCLEAPPEFNDAALRSFLVTASSQDLKSATKPADSPHCTILMDDRRDPGVGPWAIRRWDGPEGYTEYPPEGCDIWPEQQKDLSLLELVSRLKENRYEKKAEKRTIYISNITASCMVALAGTASNRSLPTIRKFFSHVLNLRTVFRITLDATFTLEFHLPYLALRTGNNPPDRRRLAGSPLRTGRVLPLCPSAQARNDASYYESKISFLVTGIDEWLWTSYCCVDNFYGIETYRRDCVDDRLDPASGGCLWLDQPPWNPRQFFLVVLSRRMEQVAWEWEALVNCFIARLDQYESFFSILDDEKLTKTRELTLAVSCLREFRDILSGSIRAWDNFESNYIRLFETPRVPKLHDFLQEYIVQIRVSVFQLKDLHALMSQKLDKFNSMRDGLVNASALKESAEATRQGNNIGILTRMTVLYLPLSLATAVFSVTMMPGSNWLWLAYGFALCLTTVATVYAARNPALLDIAFAAVPAKGRRAMI